MPITKRTLTKWRKEALEEKYESWTANTVPIVIEKYIELQDRILRMTQELLDQHLMKGK